jgi:hypothetical protein
MLKASFSHGARLMLIAFPFFPCNFPPYHRVAVHREENTFSKKEKKKEKEKNIFEAVEEARWVIMMGGMNSAMSWDHFL